MGKWKPKRKSSPVIVRPLDTPENRAKLETTINEIQSEMGTVFGVMEKVAWLKASRLYLLTHKSWDDFVDEEFHFTKQWADELIAAYDGKLYLESEHAITPDESNGNSGFHTQPKLPPKLTSIKALAAVGRIAQNKNRNPKAVLSRAAKSGKLNHKSIRKAEVEIERERKARKAEKEADSPIPAKVAQAIEAGKMVRDYIKTIRMACKRLDDFAKSAYGCFLSAGQHTDAIRRSLEPYKFAAPYADCVHCGGHGECKPCKSTGWLRKVDFDALPIGLRSTSRIVDVESVESGEEEGVAV